MVEYHEYCGMCDVFHYAYANECTALALSLIHPPGGHFILPLLNCLIAFIFFVLFSLGLGIYVTLHTYISSWI